MRNKIIVTFDFDGTLSRKDVQEYAIELMKKGIDVWVLTTRYDELHKHRYEPNPTNDDLWEVIRYYPITLIHKATTIYLYT